MRKPSIAWVEEWMSWRAERVLPYLAERFDITYISAGDEVPKANFAAIERVRRSKYMMLAGFGLSRRVDELYRSGRIELAVVYASIGFAIRSAPYISVEGGSVYYQSRLFAALSPWCRKPRFAIGYVHYVLPEIFCVRRARRVVANSHALKRDLMVLHHLPDDRVDVVCNGIGQEYLDIYNQGKSPPSRVRALYVGRLHPGKGIVDVLSEFTRRRGMNVEFMVVGDGPERSAVEAIARLDHRVLCVGALARPALIGALEESDIFVFPSYHEGFPSSLAEAMAAGLACLTYDIPVTREVLGDSGFMIPRGNARAMVDRLAELADGADTRRRSGVAAHECVRRFSWDMCARGFEDVISRELVVVRSLDGQPRLEELRPSSSSQ